MDIDNDGSHGGTGAWRGACTAKDAKPGLLSSRLKNRINEDAPKHVEMRKGERLKGRKVIPVPIATYCFHGSFHTCIIELYMLSFRYYWDWDGHIQI